MGPLYACWSLFQRTTFFSRMLVALTTNDLLLSHHSVVISLAFHLLRVQEHLSPGRVVFPTPHTRLGTQTVIGTAIILWREKCLTLLPSMEVLADLAWAIRTMVCAPRLPRSIVSPLMGLTGAFRGCKYILGKCFFYWLGGGCLSKAHET